MNWTGVVIHHSASGDVSASTIDQWHKSRGFREIGYNYVIRESGIIEPARYASVAGAHALGRNASHLGICLTGHFGQHAPTLAQINSLVHLTKGICDRYQIDVSNVERHHEHCPGRLFPWNFFIESLSFSS